MRFFLKAAMIFFVASSVNIQAQAGDTNPPIDNQSVTVDFSNVIIIPSDKSGYSGMIKVDNTHKIYLKCLSITGDQDMTTLVPCTLENGKLAAEQTTWVPFQTLQAVLFFEPKATSVSGLISGSIGSSTLNSANLLGINADSTPILRVHNPPAEFAYPFSYGSSNPPAGFSLAAAGADADTGVSVLKLVAQFIGTIAAAPGDTNAYYKVNLDSVTWTTKSQYKLKVRTLGDGDGSHDTCAECIDDPPASKISDGDTITLPLGSRALISLKDAADGSDIPATFSLDGSPSFNPAISAADQSKGLYMDRLGILLGSKVAGQQDSIWVHMGSQALVITPNDPTKPPVTINVNVNSPSSLGIAKTQYDGLIIQYAHLRGIAPEIIKGEIRKESNFIPEAFRYEPGFNKRYVPTISFMEKPYRQYALADVRDVATIANKYIHPRSTYGIYINNIAVAVPDDYEKKYNKGLSLKCYDLMTVNNKGVLPNFIARNWDTSYTALPPSESLDPSGHFFKDVVKSINKYNFTAQTVVASSYGLMQPMYSTITNAKYGGYQALSGLGKDPLDLFKPDINIQYATRYLAYVFKLANGNENSAPNSFTDFGDYKIAWEKGFLKYNSGPGSKKKDMTYSVLVWSFHINYFPIKNSEIFGQ